MWRLDGRLLMIIMIVMMIAMSDDYYSGWYCLCNVQFASHPFFRGFSLVYLYIGLTLFFLYFVPLSLSLSLSISLTDYK